MQPRFNSLWLILIIPFIVFSALYLWFSVFPGRINPDATKYFSLEHVNQARHYSRVLRVVFISSMLFQGAFLIWLAFSGRAGTLTCWFQRAAGGNYWGSVVLYSLGIWVFMALLNFPFVVFSSYYWQRRWGFSTQSLGDWWLDYFKGVGIDLVLFLAGVVLLFWIMGRWPRIWWLTGAVFFSLWLVIQTYLWPVVVSPLFNRFEPVQDPAIISMVLELSRKAEIPIDQALVMDASRRTTKSNAYFTGLGRTKRIVLYDTLLANYPLDEVKAVVAHEIAHWRQGHIIQGLSWGALGLFTSWGFLFILLRQTLPLATRNSPQILPMVLLYMLLVSFISTPVESHISRGMEEEADRVAVALTGDIPAAVRLQVNLAGKNLSDVSPAAFIHWFSYSHPPAVARINNIEQAGSR